MVPDSSTYGSPAQLARSPPMSMKTPADDSVHRHVRNSTISTFEVPLNHYNNVGLSIQELDGAPTVATIAELPVEENISTQAPDDSASGDLTGLGVSTSQVPKIYIAYSPPQS